MPHSAPHRIIRYINIVIAVVLIVALGAVYWYAYRPLPQTSGTISESVKQRAICARDALGVPHISAGSEEDALFVQGYVTAQDRLWQMDGLRRLAGGNLAEILGPAGLELDRESRRLRMRRIAEDAYASMPAGDRALLAAYARGVNFFLNTHRGPLPVEFTLLGYRPLPWGVTDSILIGLQMFRSLSSTWKEELAKRNMLVTGDPAKVNFLFPARSGSEVQPGSNGWAVSGFLTASGRPLLSNDAHLEWSVPGVWYMAHLQAPGLDVAGVSLPGLPGLLIGHNRRIAWGATNLQFDVQDLYREKLDDRTGRYLFRGQLEPARRERERIRVKGQPATEMLNWVTRHGPLFITQANERLALRWVAAEPGPFPFPFLELDKAQNWQQFTAALSRYAGPALNFVYADVDGNIGYHAAGRLPVRKGYTGDLPVDGSSGQYEWQGFIPFDQLPSVLNPPAGIIVTANQNPFPANYPYAVSGNFSAQYRSNQIRNLLRAKKSWRAEDMLAVQRDVYSGFSRYLAQSIVSAYEQQKAQDPDLANAIALLRAWNGQMDKDQAAPLIVMLAYQHLRRAVAENASPSNGAAYEVHMAPAVVEKLLRTRPAGWFPDYDLILLRSFMDAMEEGRRMQGRDVQKWAYGNYLRLLIPHPIGHRLPLLATYFDIGPAPMSGSFTTVKQTTRRLGPSMRMNVDLADWDRSLLNVTTGQSGQVLSPHYKDEWPSYYVGQSFPMQFQKVQARQVLQFVPGGNP